MSNRTGANRMSQDTFMMLAAVAVLKTEELEALKKEETLLCKTKCNRLPVLQSLDEAYREMELTAEMEEVQAELGDLAQEMRNGGIPCGVWIRYPRENTRDVMLRIVDSEPAQLFVNDYTGP